LFQRKNLRWRFYPLRKRCVSSEVTHCHTHTHIAIALRAHFLNLPNRQRQHTAHPHPTPTKEPMRPAVLLLLVLLAVQLANTTAQEVEHCEANTVLSGANGVVSEPVTGAGKYLRDRTCSWHIDTGDADTILFNFISLDTELRLAVSLFSLVGLCRVVLQLAGWRRRCACLVLISYFCFCVCVCVCVCVFVCVCVCVFVCAVVIGGVMMVPCDVYCACSLLASLSVLLPLPLFSSFRT
jgi:hypothetical protein